MEDTEEVRQRCAEFARTSAQAAEERYTAHCKRLAAEYDAAKRIRDERLVAAALPAARGMIPVICEGYQGDDRHDFLFVHRWQAAPLPSRGGGRKARWRRAALTHSPAP